MGLEGTLLGGNAIHMHCTVTALGSDELVHRIPCDALDIVVMFCKFPDAGPVRNAEDTSGIVGAASNYVLPCRAPSKIVDFVCRATVR